MPAGRQAEAGHYAPGFMIFHAELDAQKLGSVAPESQFQAVPTSIQASESGVKPTNYIRQGVEVTAQCLAPPCRERISAHRFSLDMHFPDTQVARILEFSQIRARISICLTSELFQAREGRRFVVLFFSVLMSFVFRE